MTARINLNRRSFFIVSGVAGMTGLLAACGGNSNTSSAEPYYPIEGLFGTGLVHPAMEDPAIFNDGLLDTINNDYLSGPYEVDNWDSAQKALTVVPNENWWGEKPLLDRINFRQMEASAAPTPTRPPTSTQAGSRSRFNSQVSTFSPVFDGLDVENRRKCRNRDSDSQLSKPGGSWPIYVILNS